MVGRRGRHGIGRGRAHAASGVSAVRSRNLRGRRDRCRVGDIRLARHRAFRVEQVIVARPESKANERPRVGHGFRLPAMIRLIAAHGIFAFLIPCTRRLARHVVFADERFLDRLRPLRGYLLLPADGRFLLAVFSRAHMPDFAAVRGNGWIRLHVLVGRGMRRKVSLLLRG